MQENKEKKCNTCDCNDKLNATQDYIIKKYFIEFIINL